MKTALRRLGVAAPNSMSPSLCILAALILPASVGRAEVPDMIAAPGQALVVTVHAQGTQVYECKADDSGKLAWQFREPIATLIKDGKTVGRHYAGPNWELTDGSVVLAKVVESAPGATPKDILLLKLEVVSRRGAGQLSEVATIQRLNTKGGAAERPCEAAGALLNVPYSADYTFFKKARWSLLRARDVMPSPPL
jgi:hypothetical protein